MQAITENRLLRGLVAVAETLFMLGGVFLLTLGLTLPFMPMAVRAEFALHKVGRDSLSHDELLEEVASLEVADRADIVLKRGSHHLVLHDVSSKRTAEVAVPRLLADSGYGAGPMASLRLPDVNKMVESPSELIPSLGIQGAMFLLIGAALIRWRLVPTESRSRAGPVGAVLVGALGGFAAFFLGALVALGLDQAGIRVEEQEWLKQLLVQPGAVVKLLPWFVVVLPLAEEVFFRGYVFRFLTQRTGFPTGFLVSSAMFAAVHLNLSGFLVYMAVGCVFALALSRTSNLVAPVTAHMVYNASVLFVGVVVAPHFT